MDKNKLTCVRYSLILFNLAFMVFGLMIAGFSYFGLKCREDLLEVLYELNPGIKTIRKCFTITGLIILMNAIFGLTAIFRKRLSILIAFCFILIGLFVFTLFSIVIGTISYRNLMSQNSTSSAQKFTSLMSRFDWKDPNHKTSQMVNDIQIEFECCGDWNGSVGWEQFRPSYVPLGAYPWTCCDHQFRPQPSDLWCDEQQVRHQESCSTALEDHINRISNTLQTVIDITSESALVQLFCIICIFLLRSQPVDRNVPLIENITESAA